MYFGDIYVSVFKIFENSNCCLLCFLVSLVPSPPYPSGTFDRILLDAPCSALGQRPQFVVRMNLKELQSYPRLQKKLFTTVSNKNCSCDLSLHTV